MTPADPEGLRRFEHQLIGAVAAPVVDENRLRVAVKRVHHLNEAGGQLLDHALLVVRRDYQRVRRHEMVTLSAAVGQSKDVIGLWPRPLDPTQSSGLARLNGLTSA